MSLRFRILSLVVGLFALGGAGCGHMASRPSNILFLSDRDGDWALYAMAPDGSNQRRVLAAGAADPFGQGFGFGEPLVSPDGRRVLLSRDGLTVATLATGVLRRIGAGEESSAAWSPDGKSVVFSGPQDEGLYVANVQGGKHRTLLLDSQVFDTVWSPDGRSIAFDRQIDSGPRELYTVRRDGTGLMRLDPRGSGSNLAWSRDGKLAFIGSREEEKSAHLIVIDMHTRRVVVIQRGLGGGTVAWSPDGRTIAYATTVGRSNLSALYIARADGSDLHRLTPSRAPYSDGSPVWPPDGKSLLFVRTPLGAGAERETSEVWTMRLDGSHQHQLTHAYPAGGDNSEPAWTNGPVHVTEAPRSRETRRSERVVLRVPFAVDGIAADSAHAAIAPLAYEMERDVKPTPPILMWRPGHGEQARLIASQCGGISELVLTRSRLALDCDQQYFDQISQAVWVYDLRTAVPREVFYSEAGPARSANGDILGMYVDNIVGGGGLLAFGSSRVKAHRPTVRRALWRIDRLYSLNLRSRPDTGDLVAADGRRLAVELADGRIAILRIDGSLVRVFPLRRRVRPFGADGKPPFLLVGRDLLALGRTTLDDYDTATGRLRWERPVPAGAQLEGANGRLVVYTAGPTVHLLSGGREKIIQTHARTSRELRYYGHRPLHAALTESGLYYCFNVADPDYPGRVVFVPLAAQPR